MRQMRNYSLLASAMLTFTFTACSNNDIETIPYEGPVPVQVTAGIDGILTRASDAAWGKNDAIGISCKSTNTNYTNMKYVTADGDGAFDHYNNDGKDVAGGIFFQGTDQVTFSAYYPYAGSEKTMPGTNGVITSRTESQSTKQNEIDYLYADGLETNYKTPNISFSTDATKFKHKMTRLKLVLETSADAGFSADDVKGGTYVLGGLKHEGTFDTTKGLAEATSTATVNDNWSVSTNCPSADDDSKKQRTYTMILYPQTVGGALTFTATISNQNYKNTANIKFDNDKLQPGTSYTFTITIKKTGLTVSSCTLDGWGPETTGKGDAKM